MTTPSEAIREARAMAYRQALKMGIVKPKSTQEFPACPDLDDLEISLLDQFYFDVPEVHKGLDAMKYGYLTERQALILMVYQLTLSKIHLTKLAMDGIERQPMIISVPLQSPSDTPLDKEPHPTAVDSASCESEVSDP